MAGDIDAQRTALKLLWPEISAYCAQRGVPRDRLLVGVCGIPIDGRKLLARCERLLLTKYELADQAGVRYDTIIKIMNGKRNPSAAVLNQLIRALECDPSDLFLEGPAD